MSDSPFFTVFTPTFNRAATLGRVYESLCAQTFLDFEWLIVDDGSTDETYDLVAGWQAEAGFPIRYFRQPNGGKHRAFNRGVREAHGELFLTLDSDDTCVADALARLKFHWDSIPAGARETFSAVTVLCADAEGRVVGDRFPRDVFDANSISLQHKYLIRGEKWGFHRTTVLRKFPFPEFDGERFIPESVVWNRIAQHYRTRYVNEALRTYEIGSDSLSRRSVRIRTENPQGTDLYYRELLKLSLPVRAKLKVATNFVRFSLHARKTPVHLLTEGTAPGWLAAVFLVGYLCFRSDTRKH